MTLKHWTLARAKAIAVFLGALLTYATTLSWGAPLPHWTTAAALALTFVGTYAVPNATVRPDASAAEPRHAVEPALTGDGPDCAPSGEDEAPAEEPSEEG